MSDQYQNVKDLLEFACIGEDVIQEQSKLRQHSGGHWIHEIVGQRLRGGHRVSNDRFRFRKFPCGRGFPQCQIDINLRRGENILRRTARRRLEGARQEGSLMSDRGSAGMHGISGRFVPVSCARKRRAQKYRHSKGAKYSSPPPACRQGRTSQTPN